MKTFLLLLAAFSAALCVSALAADNAPVPPMQGKPWTPPETKLPPVVVSAIKELFDQGLADPRGCEYREVEIPNSETYEPNSKIHAWVLPGDGKTRFAVGWNGRVIPVVNVGPAADLKKDLTPKAGGQGPFSQVAWGIYDLNSLSEKSVLPIKAALLLRLSEAELAENVMKNVQGNPDSDPYLTMAREWIICWFHCGVAAHNKGDDKLALQIFHTIAGLENTATETAKRRNISNGGSDFPELRGLALLTADQERRANEPPHVAAVNAGIVDQHERIAALIRDLETANGESFFSEYGPDMSWDANVHALIEEGDAAVEPLLDCLENDERLTRAEFYSGGGMTRMIPDHPEPPGPWIRVYEPAYIALTAILRITPKIDLPQGKSPHELTADDRKALAAKFREYLAAHKGQTPAERLFARLQDDKADPDEWFHMGDELAQHTNEESIPQGMFGGGGGSGGGGNDPVVLRCESLRDKSNPSVSDVFIKRFLQLLSFYRHGGAIDPDKLGNFLREFADWSGTERLDDLRKLTQRYNAEIGYGGGAANLNVSIYTIRLAHGNNTALAEYARWLSQLQPDNIPEGNLNAVFALMWQHQDDPEVRKAADALFGGADSFWHPNKEHGITQLINTPMLGLQPFREQVLRALNDTTVIGFARRWPNNPNVEVHLNDQGEDNHPQDSPPKTDVRVCDYYAGQLVSVETFPDFQFDWPAEKREAAVAACKAMLEQYGDAYRFYPADPQSDVNRGSNGHTSPAFARLDHPATREDVAKGRAIFSLTGKVRVWPMPNLPLYADRPASKQDPSQGSQIDEHGNSKQVTSYTTDGHVWQAEEMLIGGKWERFYGFVGRHQIEKVPASEINFPAGGMRTWTKVTPFFEGAVIVSDAQGLRAMEGSGSYALSGTNVPLELVFKAHNSNGLDRALPPELTIPPGAKKMLPAAITLKLSYTEKIAPNIARMDAMPPKQKFFMLSVPPQFDYGEWTDLRPAKEVAVSNGKTPGPLIGAASEATVLQIALRDFFDMSKPGTYRLQVGFGAYGLTPEETQYRPPNQFTFTVLSPTK